jgi:ribosomal protein L40E
MITCPACGKENEDSAVLCKRCRGPLRDEDPGMSEPELAPVDPSPPAPPEPEPEQVAAPPPPVAEDPISSDSLGEVCRNCEAYNEPGTRLCTNCGFDLFGGEAGQTTADAREPSLDHTPPQAFAAPDLDHTPPQAFAAPDLDEAAEPPLDHTPPDGSPSVSDELSALAISAEEAAEAGLNTSGNGALEEEPPLDKTPPQAFAPPHVEEEPEPPPPPPPAPSRSKAAEAAALGGAAGISAKRAPEPPPPARPPPEPPPAEKICSNCNAPNPPAAKFCFDCGTPFARKSEAPRPPPEPVKAEPPPPPPPPRVEPIKARAEPVKPMPARAEPPPSIQIDESMSLDSATSESAPLALAEEAPAEEALPAEELPPEEVPPEEAPPEEVAAEDVEEALPAEEAEPVEELPAEAVEEAEPVEELPAEAVEELPAEALAEPVEEAPPPFQASLVVEKGAAIGTSFLLGRLENSVGGPGAHIELGEDPFVAPHAATLLFTEDHLVLRDEGSANGVFLKVRESALLEAGDLFIAGERLFRFDGATELARNGEGDTPFLGAPRPNGAIAVRVSEVLAGGRTGRTCHRSGPAISIGRTGCDMNFPSDTVLAAKHAEIRVAEDGGAVLVDLGQAPSGVFVRVRQQSAHDLQAGDILMIGEQQLRVDVG